VFGVTEGEHALPADPSRQIHATVTRLRSPFEQLLGTGQQSGAVRTDNKPDDILARPEFRGGSVEVGGSVSGLGGGCT
jgi:hypothetical protein